MPGPKDARATALALSATGESNNALSTHTPCPPTSSAPRDGSRASTALRLLAATLGRQAAREMLREVENARDSGMTPPGLIGRHAPSHE